MVVVRVTSERVVVGISGSEMVAMVSANQDNFGLEQNCSAWG